jgi:peroxiredoxin
MIHFGVAILGLLLATQPEPAAVGKPAPDFKALDETGATHELAQYRGRAVVLEWTNPDCPYVERHYSADTMEKLAVALGATDVVWLAVNSTHSNTPADTKAWKAAQGFAYPTLQDPDGTIGHLYGARTTPHLFVIDGQGVLRYDGAIDDDPYGKSATPVNYVGAAVKALLAGASPDPSETKPYGCSVKYK